MSELRNTKHGLLQTPVELLQQILASLPEPRSLVSAIRTSRLLYLSFKQHEQHIISSVLINCFGTGGVLREAELTLDCTPPVPRTDPRESQVDPIACVERFFGADLEGSHCRRSRWTLRDAWEIHSFHADVVVPLMDRLVQASSDPESCAVSAGLNQSLKTRPISNMETERICRALYRFEMFRRLYGWFDLSARSHDGNLLQLCFAFCLKFAPWELVQMGCINDFLGQQVAPVFNDVARHDITWGHANVDFNTRAAHETIQHILSLGLREILTIARLQDTNYQEREALLDPDNHIPAKNGGFFNAALFVMNFYAQPSDGADLLYKTISSAKPFYGDADPGPETMWRLSCPQDGSSLALFEEHDWIFRRWGYVLWDHERLCDLARQGVIRLSPPWEPAVSPQLEYSTTTEQEQEVSWRARSSLYVRGGRGWWAEGDESRVRWGVRLPSREEQRMERELELELKGEESLPGENEALLA
ncbi:hypothetical protein DHEL01_v202342 [Diaporthe helianthi]|uniref:F-box domain-containing protein n=1 Tax=Diaporthe helianthi TaxID=158607 RepID=A0A2P5I9S2_DIAHE|nr:hypothetical protein DHEL01_v202342 [Diaporthe helianthi]